MRGGRSGGNAGNKLAFNAGEAMKAKDAAVKPTFRGEALPCGPRFIRVAF